MSVLYIKVYFKQILYEKACVNVFTTVKHITLLNGWRKTFVC